MLKWYLLHSVDVGSGEERPRTYGSGARIEHRTHQIKRIRSLVINRSYQLSIYRGETSHHERVSYLHPPQPLPLGQPQRRFYATKLVYLSRSRANSELPTKSFAACMNSKIGGRFFDLDALMLCCDGFFSFLLLGVPIHISQATGLECPLSFCSLILRLFRRLFPPLSSPLFSSSCRRVLTHSPASQPSSFNALIEEDVSDFVVPHILFGKRGPLAS